MSKKNLPHSAAERENPNISRLLAVYGAAGYGCYWILLELLSKAPGKMMPLRPEQIKSCAIEMHTDLNTAAEIINFCLQNQIFEGDGGFFWSPALRTTTKKREKPEYPEDSAYYKMALYLKQKVDEMASSEGLTHLTENTNLQTWADDFRKLVELDKQTDRDLIKSVIDWVTKDAFWRSNILSAAKLREKFPKLVIEMRSSGRRGRGPDKPKISIISRYDEQEPRPSDEEFAEMIKAAAERKARKEREERARNTARR